MLRLDDEGRRAGPECRLDLARLAARAKGDRLQARNTRARLADAFDSPGAGIGDQQAGSVMIDELERPVGLTRAAHDRHAVPRKHVVNRLQPDRRGVQDDRTQRGFHRRSPYFHPPSMTQSRSYSRATCCKPSLWTKKPVLLGVACHPRRGANSLRAAWCG